MKKVEPKSHAVSIDKVANIGVQIVRTHPQTKELYTGRGYEAPKASPSAHAKGSQGKY